MLEFPEIQCMEHEEKIIVVELSKVCERKRRAFCEKCLNDIKCSDSCNIQKIQTKFEALIDKILLDIEECQKHFADKLSATIKVMNTIKEKIQIKFDRINEILDNELQELKQTKEKEEKYYKELKQSMNRSKLEEIAQILSGNHEKSQLPNFNKKVSKAFLDVAVVWKSLVSEQQKVIKQINDIFSSKTLISELPFENSCCVLACNQQKNMIVGGRGSEIVIWQQKDSKLIESTVLKGHNDTITTIVLNSQGDMIVSGGERNDRQIKVWKNCDNQWDCIQTLKEHKQRINDLQISKNQDLLISASNDQLIKIWKIKQSSNKFECMQTLDDHKHKVYWISIDQECQFISSSSGQNYFFIHQYSQDPKPWKQLQQIKTQGITHRIFFTQSNQLLVQQANPPKIIIYSNLNNEFQAMQEIDLNQSDNDDILFPVFQVYNTVYLKNNQYLNIIKMTKSGKYFIESILAGQFRSGCVDTTGKFIILRNYGNKSVEIYKSYI